MFWFVIIVVLLIGLAIALTTDDDPFDMGHPPDF